jgi:sugar O-acyltransferase (sialic acid O-acetyltransferase NeuD family)
MEGNMPSKRIVIIGARLDGHASMVLDVLKELDDFKVVGFIDNAPDLQNKLIGDIPVIGSADDIGSFKIEAEYIHIAIGDNVARGNLFKLMTGHGFKVITLIHPSSIINKKANIGNGSFIGPGAVINNDVAIGEATIVNTGAIVEHHNILGYAVYLGTGVKTSERVLIDDFVFVGIGATILPDIKISSGAMIGAGSTVNRDVSLKTTAMDYAERSHHKNIYVETKPDVAVSDNIYVSQPTLPDYPSLDAKFRDIANSLMLSNFSKYSNELETAVENLLSVKKALTFPNATSALMLAIKVLGLTGEIILPSFTFSATGHAVAWNDLTPVFADIDPNTFNIDIDDVEKKITSKTSAIVAVHVFGNPADIDKLAGLAKKYDLKLIFDSAHALGSKYKGKCIGSFGDIEIFSLSGTKVVTSAEGGITTSNDEDLMKMIDIGRNYGAGEDYNCKSIGLNGKMSEFHAAIALESLLLLNRFVSKRNELANLYKKRLNKIPGISFQHIPEDNVTTYKDFSIIIDKKSFGMDRDELVNRLDKESIFTKKYFFPLHHMDAYKKIECRAENLKNTDFIANNIICLPMFSHMGKDAVEKVCFSIYRIRNI